MGVRTDEEVMAAVRDGDVSAFDLLFERHHTRLYNFFLRLTGRPGSSEDLVQEVFLRMLRYRASYRGAGPFRAWMYRIARNVFSDYLREAIPLRDATGEVPDLVDPERSPFDEARRGEEIAMLKEALLKLPPDRREILVLSRFEGLTFEEIAGLLDCSVGAAKVRAHRALAQLRDVYFTSRGERDGLRDVPSVTDGRSR